MTRPIRRSTANQSILQIVTVGLLKLTMNTNLYRKADGVSICRALRADNSRGEWRI